MQEYKRKTNRGKTTQDVIDQASASAAGGQCSKNGATFKTNDVVFRLPQPKVLGSICDFGFLWI